MNISGYRDRIVDAHIERYLRIFGAVCVEGPKWCGKTWTSKRQAKSAFMVGDPAGNFQNRRLVSLDISSAFKGEWPHLIDEWQEFPELWDATRVYVDESQDKGQFILTGSSTPKRKGVMHTGTGRIASVLMQPMTLWESGISEGKVSLRELCEGRRLGVVPVDNPELGAIAEWIVRGGWPGALGMPIGDAMEIPRQYLHQIEQNDIHRVDDVRRDVHKVDLLLRSLARNEATTSSIATLCSDISASDGTSVDADTASSYLAALNRMFVLSNQKPFSANVRSSVRVKQMEKRHFCDPSLACAALKLTPQRLMGDLEFMGLLFEALVERDLRVYAASFGAELMHYQDYAGKEIDAVVEMPDGEWAAIEVKLGTAQEDRAAAGLIALKDEIAAEKNGRPPRALIIIVGRSAAAYTRQDGVSVVPISCLKP